MKVEEIKEEAKKYTFSDLKGLTNKVKNLKHEGLGFLGCVTFVQYNQEISLLKARELLLKLEVYSEDEKARIDTMHKLMLSEFQE